MDLKERSLRKRKPNRRYSDGWKCGLASDDEDSGFIKNFNIAEKLNDEKFLTSEFVKVMDDGRGLNVQYLQQNGFDSPIVCKEKSGLDLRVPDKDNFTVNDVRINVGSSRMVDVIDVETQENLEMSMSSFQKYFENPEKRKLLNVISLEFSHTKLGKMVETPRIVRKIDWVDTVWPVRLKTKQKDSTNALDQMFYPKVQKYVLMSVKNCYTDFHIDFGGSSVWYHVLNGEKVFWLIPPTRKNFDLYKKWILSGRQNDVFFGDLVEKCQVIRLKTGNTFFMPSGWIHAVYTPSDSIIFGGNFLNSFNIQKQIEVANLENAVRVPDKYKFPFFNQILWYALLRYKKILRSVSLLKTIKKSSNENYFVHQSVTSAGDYAIPSCDNLLNQITPEIMKGLSLIVEYLDEMPTDVVSFPFTVKDQKRVLSDMRLLIDFKDEKSDSACDSINGESGDLGDGDSSEATVISSVGRKPKKSLRGMKKLRISGAEEFPSRYRRTRCKTCPACVSDNCGSCSSCRNMKRYGGTGTSKQSCVVRRCVQPVLPKHTACVICRTMRFDRVPKEASEQLAPDLMVGKLKSEDVEGSVDDSGTVLKMDVLMECSICYKVQHPGCYFRLNPQQPVVYHINSYLSSSWKCPDCYKPNDPMKCRPRRYRARKRKTIKYENFDLGSPESTSGCKNQTVDNDAGDVMSTVRGQEKHEETEDVVMNADSDQLQVYDEHYHLNLLLSSGHHPEIKLPPSMDDDSIDPYLNNLFQCND